MHVGSSDGQMEQRLFAVGGFTSLAWMQARQALGQAEMQGTITIHEILQSERLPFPSNSLALLVLNAAALPDEAKAAVTEDEMLRVLRPGGVAFVQDSGQTMAKPQNDKMDSWTHYEYNAASTNHSMDEAVDVPRSLQWLCGDTNFATERLQMRSAGGVHVSIQRKQHHRAGRHYLPHTITGRDPFSGVTLWTRRGFNPGSRWTFLVDDQSVYVHAANLGESGS